MRVSFLLLFQVIFISSLAQSYTEWELAKDKDGIKVYTREVTDSRIKEFRAESTVESTLSSVVAVMTDINSIPDWVEEAESSKLLDQLNERDLFYYLEIEVPFPFDNRDMIQHLVIRQDKETKKLTFSLSNAPNYIPVDDKRVRMPAADGIWEFTPIGNGKLKIHFQYLNDPGGGIPAWLVNSFIVKSPFNSVTNLKKQVSLAKYSEKMYDWVLEE